MKKTVLILLCAALVTSGCATSPYLTDRGRDAADIVTLTVGKGLGVAARVGPLPFAWGVLNDKWGLQGGGFGRLEDSGTVGISPAVVFDYIDPPDGEAYERRKVAEVASFWLFSFHRDFFSKGKDPGGPNYITQIEVGVGLGGSIRLGFNPGELLDFILGWTTLDIFNDDLEWKKRQSNQGVDGDRVSRTLSTASSVHHPFRLFL